MEFICENQWSLFVQMVNKTFRIRNSTLGGRKFAELSRISYKKLEVMVTTNRTHTFKMSIRLSPKPFEKFCDRTHTKINSIEFLGNFSLKAKPQLNSNFRLQLSTFVVSVCHSTLQISLWMNSFLARSFMFVSWRL